MLPANREHIALPGPIPSRLPSPEHERVLLQLPGVLHAPDQRSRAEETPGLQRPERRHHLEHAPNGAICQIGQRSPDAGDI